MGARLVWGVSRGKKFVVGLGLNHTPRACVELAMASSFEVKDAQCCHNFFGNFQILACVIQFFWQQKIQKFHEK